MKKNKNIFMYIAILLVLASFAYLYIGQQKDVTLFKGFLTSNNEYNTYSEGANEITMSGVLTKDKNGFNYYASFKENYMIVENRSRSSKFAVKKIGSGLLAFEGTTKPIVLRIDYEDTYDEDKKRNIRTYLLDIQEGERNVKVEEEIYLTNPQPSPIEGLDLLKIITDNSIDLR